LATTSSLTARSKEASSFRRAALTPLACTSSTLALAANTWAFAPRTTSLFPDGGSLGICISFAGESGFLSLTQLSLILLLRASLCTLSFASSEASPFLWAFRILTPSPIFFFTLSRDLEAAWLNSFLHADPLRMQAPPHGVPFLQFSAILGGRWFTFGSQRTRGVWLRSRQYANRWSRDAQRSCLPDSWCGCKHSSAHDQDWQRPLRHRWLPFP